jgi:hypothetical protein
MSSTTTTRTGYAMITDFVCGSGGDTTKFASGRGTDAIDVVAGCRWRTSTGNVKEFAARDENQITQGDSGGRVMSGGVIQAVVSANYSTTQAGPTPHPNGAVRIFASTYSRTNQELLRSLWTGGLVPVPGGGETEWPLDDTPPAPARLSASGADRHRRD